MERSEKKQAPFQIILQKREICLTFIKIFDNIIVRYSEKVSEDTKNAVKEVFVFGNKMHDSVLWFYAPEWCESEWHESQQFVAEIGGHRFFCQKGAAE